MEELARPGAIEYTAKVVCIVGLGIGETMYGASYKLSYLWHLGEQKGEERFKVITWQGKCDKTNHKGRKQFLLRRGGLTM